MDKENEDLAKQEPCKGNTGGGDAAATAQAGASFKNLVITHTCGHANPVCYVCEARDDSPYKAMLPESSTECLAPQPAPELHYGSWQEVGRHREDEGLSLK